MMPEPQGYARIVSVTLRPETLDLAFERYRDVSTPLIRRQPGSVGVLGAANRETGNIYAISFWETLDDVERSNANPQVVDAMAGYAEWIAGPLTIAAYRILNGALPDPGSDARGESARLTTVETLPDQTDAVTAELRERLERIGADSPACMGVLLMAPHVGHHLIAFELWSSATALQRSEGDAAFQDQRLWRAGMLAGPPRREILEVFGRF